MSILPCSSRTEVYYYNVMNDKFNGQEPTDPKKNPMVLKRPFSEAIDKYTMRNFYKYVDFIPYLY